MTQFQSKNLPMPKTKEQRPDAVFIKSYAKGLELARQDMADSLKALKLTVRDVARAAGNILITLAGGTPQRPARLSPVERREGLNFRSAITSEFIDAQKLMIKYRDILNPLAMQLAIVHSKVATLRDIFQEDFIKQCPNIAQRFPQYLAYNQQYLFPLFKQIIADEKRTSQAFGSLYDKYNIIIDSLGKDREDFVTMLNTALERGYFPTKTLKDLGLEIVKTDAPPPDLVNTDPPQLSVDLLGNEFVEF